MISLARLFSLMKREAVLSAAAALALLSMLWVMIVSVAFNVSWFVL